MMNRYLTKCERCKSVVPAMDTFKAYGMIVCQGCYRLYSHGNEKLVDPLPRSLNGVEREISDRKLLDNARKPEDRTWYFR